MSGKSKPRRPEDRSTDSETTTELDAGGRGYQSPTEELSSPHPPVAHGFSVAVSQRPVSNSPADQWTRHTPGRRACGSAHTTDVSHRIARAQMEVAA